MRFAILMVAAIVGLGTIFGGMFEEMLVHGWRNEGTSKSSTPMHQQQFGKTADSKYPVQYRAPDPPVMHASGKFVPTKSSYIAPRRKTNRRKGRGSNPFIGN